MENNKAILLPVLLKGFEIWRLEAFSFLAFGVFMVAVSMLLGQVPLFGLALSLAVNGPLVAGIVHATRKSVLNEKPTINDFLKGAELMGPLMALSLVTSVLTYLGLFLLIIPGLVAHVLFCLVIPMMICEGRDIKSSIIESVNLTKQYFLPVLGLVSIFLVIEIIFTLPSLKSILQQTEPAFSVIAPAALGMVLFGPLSAIVTALLYFRLRPGPWQVVWIKQDDPKHRDRA
jgi:hypothetical protein